MKSSDEPMFGDLISDDVWIDIFKRLSVKTLGRLRCVCKEWNSIIESPYLLIHHRRHQNSASMCILLMRRGIILGHTLFLYDQDCHFDQSTILATLPFYFFGFACHSYRLNIVDAIHGVVCLSSSYETPWDGYDGVTVLYNPTMGKYVEIPDSPFASGEAYTHSVGFGFNTIQDDFYVIRLCLPVHEGMPIVYDLFSVKQGTWRKVMVGGFKIKPTKVISNNSFFMNGTIHWIISESASKGLHKMKDCSILMFHCELEEFEVMVMPKSFCRWVSKTHRRRRYHMTPAILKFRGMLALIVSWYDIWVMEEYGVTSTLKIHHFNEGIHDNNGLVLEESLFLMNVKMSSVEEHDIRDGKVRYDNLRPIIASDIGLDHITLGDFHA